MLQTGGRWAYSPRLRLCTKEPAGDGGIRTSLAASEQLRAGDGSGTRVPDGMGVLLGVPTKGFQRGCSRQSVSVGMTMGALASGIAVREAVSGCPRGIDPTVAGNTIGSNGNSVLPDTSRVLTRALTISFVG